VPCLDAVREYDRGGLDLSFSLMRKAIAVAPKEGNLRMLSGIILLRQGNAAPAERDLRLARNLGASDAGVLPPLFRAMIARHEETPLLNEFPEPAANATGEITAHILHGRALALRALKRYDEAGAALDRSLAQSRQPVALGDRADIAVRQDNMALAGKLLDEVLERDPTNGSALIAKLDVLNRLGDPAKTLAFSEQILKMYPDNIESRAVRFNVFLKLNRDGRAKAELDAMAGRSPTLPLVHYYQAVFLARHNDNDAAYQLVQALPPEFPKSHPEFATTMAKIALDHGGTELASNILGGALSAAPDLLDVRLQLASLRMAQNSPQAAMLVLNPVKDSPDPRLRKLMNQVQNRIAKDRAF
jgi:predicted Zn-dependent protease